MSILCFFSCENLDKKIELSQDANLNIKEILNSNDIILSKKDNDYNLIINETKLKTSLGKEMGASCSALILYAEVVESNPTLDYNTKFNISFKEQNNTYSYTLQDISDALEGQEIIEQIITKFDNNDVLSQNFEDNKAQKTFNEVEIDWSKIEDYSIGGFQILKDISSPKNLRLIDIRFFVFPQRIQLSFYFDRNTKKIIRVNKVLNIGQ
jgi:hypothetical protein